MLSVDVYLGLSGVSERRLLDPRGFRRDEVGAAGAPVAAILALVVVVEGELVAAAGLPGHTADDARQPVVVDRL